ncbi:MAG: hypothetical protein UT32_C0042G0001, partial [Parcubacteria group bacterium GW2011_GWC2_39_14]
SIFYYHVMLNLFQYPETPLQTIIADPELNSG